MEIKIYGIGGRFNEKIVGTAHDPETGLALLAFLAREGGKRCSLHGCMRKDEPAVSAEMSVKIAQQLFADALRNRKESQKAWVVSIHTGEYEDRETRMLKVFVSFIEAEKFKTRLDKELRDRGLDKRSSERSHQESMFHGLLVDYTGAHVSVSELPLVSGGLSAY